MNREREVLPQRHGEQGDRTTKVRARLGRNQIENATFTTKHTKFTKKTVFYHRDTEFAEFGYFFIQNSLLRGLRAST